MKEAICVSLICAAAIVTRAGEVDFCNQRLWGSGELFALDVQDNLAMSIGRGRGVELYDISDPNQPVFLSIAHLTSATKAVLDGNFIYALDYNMGVFIFDISDPTQPRRMNEPVGLFGLEHLSWENDTLFVTSQLGGLKTIDISDPEHPQIIGELLENYLGEMLPSWPYIYISNWFLDDLLVIYAGNPAHPYILTHINLDLGLRKIMMDDSYLYGLEPGFAVFDLAYPQYPWRLYKYDIPGNFRDLAATGSTFYMSEDNMIRIYKVALPEEPLHIRDLRLAGENISLEVEGNRLYALPAVHGNLATYDISNPHSPQRLGSFDQFGRVEDMVISGEVAYIAHEYGGLRILDISNEHHVTQLARIKRDARVTSVRVQDDLAYFIRDGLNIYDVSNPSQPLEMGRLDLPSDSILEVSGKHLFAGWYNGFYIVDITDPYQPTIVSVTSTGSGTEGFEVRGDLVYIARSFRGVRVYDVADPANPVLKYTTETPFMAQDLHVGEDLTLMVGGFGLLVMDTRNDLNPLGSVEIRGPANKIFVHEDRVFVGGRFDGLEIVDVSDPFHPVLVGSTPFPGRVSSMDWREDGQLFFGNQSYGHLGRGSLRDSALPEAYSLWNNPQGGLMCSAPARDIRTFVSFTNDGGFCPCPF